MIKITYLILVGCCVCLWATLIGCPSGGGGGGGGSKYSVNGTISAADNSAIDSDVNDTFTTPVPNDSFDDAQNLPNPVVLGGYVNQAGTGDTGNSYSAGDLDDYYSVSLTDNQSVTLSIAGDADLDLYLYDNTRTEVASSKSSETTETVSVPAAGSYFIRVETNSGASNYNLVVGQPITSATVLDPRMDEDFKPGNVIVAFNDDASTINGGLKKPGRSTFRAMTHKSSILDHIQVYTFSQESKDQVFRSISISPTESNRALYQTSDPEDQLKLDTLRIIDSLNKDPQIRYAEPNYRRYPLFVPDDPEYSKQWHYPLINMPQAWEITQGQDVIVAVIDTGILKNHPDMSNQLVPGYDFISDDVVANDNEPGIDDDPEDPGDESQGGSSFHGTHVSGTVAAASNNAIGVAGVAYQAKIMPLRALGVGGGYTDDILQCMKYAAGMTNDSGEIPLQPADIINMSLGGGGRQQTTQDLIDIITQDPYNVIIVAAAGNESTDSLSYPASYDGVVSVSAVGPDKSLSSYSNFGSEIDVAAPGGDFDATGDCVYSTSGDDTGGSSIQNVYSFSCGTSMAAPHMAGVVALIKAAYPALTPSELDTFIQSGSLTEDLTGDGATVRNNNFGYGLIDAFKAVSLVADPTQIPTFLVVNPLTLNFGNATTQLTISATASNDNNPLSILDVTDDADWLEVAEDYVDADNLGDYTVTVDRESLTDGPYYATITFDADGSDDVEISVIMYVGNISVPGNSGFHYVLLLNGTTFATMYQDEASVNNGTYSYSFPSVAEGSYIVFAGTDSDNDRYIGDAGEASGAYISLDQPVYLYVDRDRSGIDFSTVFEQSVSADQLTPGSSTFTGYRRLE